MMNKHGLWRLEGSVFVRSSTHSDGLHCSQPLSLLCVLSSLHRVEPTFEKEVAPPKAEGERKAEEHKPEAPKEEGGKVEAVDQHKKGGEAQEDSKPDKDTAEGDKEGGEEKKKKKKEKEKDKVKGKPEKSAAEPEAKKEKEASTETPEKEKDKDEEKHKASEKEKDSGKEKDKDEEKHKESEKEKDYQQEGDDSELVRPALRPRPFLTIQTEIQAAALEKAYKEEVERRASKGEPPMDDKEMAHWRAEWLKGKKDKLKEAKKMVKEEKKLEGEVVKEAEKLEKAVEKAKEQHRKAGKKVQEAQGSGDASVGSSEYSSDEEDITKTRNPDEAVV